MELQITTKLFYLLNVMQAEIALGNCWKKCHCMWQFVKDMFSLRKKVREQYRIEGKTGISIEILFQIFFMNFPFFME